MMREQKRKIRVREIIKNENKNDEIIKNEKKNEKRIRD